MDQDFDQIDEAYEAEADVESGFIFISKVPRTNPLSSGASNGSVLVAQSLCFCIHP